jgi:hypothetical protein
MILTHLWVIICEYLIIHVHDSTFTPSRMIILFTLLLFGCGREGNEPERGSNTAGDPSGQTCPTNPQPWASTTFPPRNEIKIDNEKVQGALEWMSKNMDLVLARINAPVLSEPLICGLLEGRKYEILHGAISYSGNRNLVTGLRDGLKYAIEYRSNCFEEIDSEREYKYARLAVELVKSGAPEIVEVSEKSVIQTNSDSTRGFLPYDEAVCFGKDIHFTVSKLYGYTLYDYLVLSGRKYVSRTEGISVLIKLFEILARVHAYGIIHGNLSIHTIAIATPNLLDIMTNEFVFLRWDQAAIYSAPKQLKKSVDKYGSPNELTYLESELGDDVFRIYEVFFDLTGDNEYVAKRDGIYDRLDLAYFKRFASLMRLPSEGPKAQRITEEILDIILMAQLDRKKIVDLFRLIDLLHDLSNVYMSN